MAIKIGVISQKGGVGKSTFVRALAVEYAKNDWDVKIYDLDLKQKTVTTWNCTRIENKIEPSLAVEPVGTLNNISKDDENYDLIIFDEKGQADTRTLEIAKNSDLVILPTGISMDDVVPQISLAHELKKKGISKDKILFTISRLVKENAEFENAKEHIEDSPYTYLGAIYEKTSITQAQNKGLSATETSYQSVNDNVISVIQKVMNKIKEL